MTRDQVHELLRRWCDGLIAHQINEPDPPERHGALMCPACQTIHGRCMDAIYPMLHMASETENPKYLKSALDLFAWSKNVSQPDGSWTVMPDPNTWKGITVFGLIALADALHYHGRLLDSATSARMTSRLDAAAQFVFENFDMQFANVNYGFSAIYALYLSGKLLDRQNYLARSQELAEQARTYFTEPSGLISGEAKPTNRLSDSGLPPVDLGYNVEESLNNLALYSSAAGDTSLFNLVETSLSAHLEFMLPDGGWDNSWGTRQYKWTYWGSRTSDGCQPAYALLAKRNPAFVTAVARNTELLERCTSENGLLYGGIHYGQHGVPACIHHTFTHAKALACLCDSGYMFPQPQTPLPREIKPRLLHFPEIGTYLAARGPWRATVTHYDFTYSAAAQQATGGALSLLWHEQLGPVLTASMASYHRLEPFNQQPDPDGEDFALTPRLECICEGQRYSNLFDLRATVRTTQKERTIRVTVSTKLNNSKRETLEGTCELIYEISDSAVKIAASTPFPARFILPILSPSGETVGHLEANTLEIKKTNATLALQANTLLEILPSKRDRVFNLVPGAQAIPVAAKVAPNQSLAITLQAF